MSSGTSLAISQCETEPGTTRRLEGVTRQVHVSDSYVAAATVTYLGRIQYRECLSKRRTDATRGLPRRLTPTSQQPRTESVNANHASTWRRAVHHAGTGQAHRAVRGNEVVDYVTLGQMICFVLRQEYKVQK